MQNDQVFLVSGNSLTGPVKTSSYQNLAIDQAVLIVHVSHFVVVSRARHSNKSQTPDVCAVKLSALVISYNSNFNASLKHKSQRFGKYVIRECKNTTINRFLGSSNNLGHVFNVLRTWEEHWLVEERLLLETVHQSFHYWKTELWWCLFIYQKLAESGYNFFVNFCFTGLFKILDFSIKSS